MANHRTDAILGRDMHPMIVKYWCQQELLRLRSSKKKKKEKQSNR